MGHCQKTACPPLTCSVLSWGPLRDFPQSPTNEGLTVGLQGSLHSAELPLPCHDCSVPPVNNISDWEPCSFELWHWASAIDGECAGKGDETRGCWEEVKRHRHARDQNHYSCYWTVEMVLHPQMPLACTSFSWHPSADSGGGETGGRKKEKVWEGPAAHRDTAEVRLAGTRPQTCPVGQHPCWAGPQGLMLMAEAQGGWQCSGNRKLCVSQDSQCSGERQHLQQ